MLKFDYDLSLKDEIITIHYQDEGFEDIPLQRFWDWVKSNEKNSWVNNYYDPSKDDGHGQDSGTYNRDEYFDLPYQVIHKDLTDYLQRKKGQGNS